MKVEIDSNASAPLISIIVPVWNGERYLKEMAMSIVSQPVRNVEVIFIDDGSTDATADIINQISSDFRYFFKQHSGICDSLNYGLEKARGQLIAFLDADDYWSPDSLALRLAVLEENPDVAMATGHVQQFYSPELLPQISQRIQCPKDPVPGYVLGALLIRRAAFDQVGEFNKQFPFTPAVDWFVRVKDIGLPVGLLTETVLYRRLHDHNISHQKVQRQDVSAILRHSLNRRRQSLASDRTPK